MNKYEIQTSKTEVKSWINNNLKNYLKKNPENVGEIEHIIDFLNSDKAPNRLQKASYSEMKSSSEKWMKTLIKKGNNIVETEEDVDLEITFEHGFRLVKLSSKEAYEREGSLMSHCVGSYHDNDNSTIYSLRDSNNKPHCTMEITKDNEGEINQLKGKGNGSIHPKYISMVLKSLQHFGLELRTSEVTYLGYDELSEQTWGLIDKNYTKVKEISFGGKRFLYRHQTFTKIPAIKCEN